MRRSLTSTEKIAYRTPAHDGISAIWKLQIAAAEAHAAGYSGSARVIMQIAEAAEQPWLRPAQDCSFADMIATLS
jgi:hypothetical protein